MSGRGHLRSAVKGVSEEAIEGWELGCSGGVSGLPLGGGRSLISVVRSLLHKLERTMTILAIWMKGACTCWREVISVHMMIWMQGGCT